MMPIEHANVLPQVFRNYFSPCCFNCRFGYCFNCRFGYGLSCRFGYHLDNSRFDLQESFLACDHARLFSKRFCCQWLNRLPCWLIDLIAAAILTVYSG